MSEGVEILLVEDDPAHAELIMRGLENEEMPVTVRHIEDGEAALDYLFQWGDYSGPEKRPSPHLIMLDLRLPKIDGLEVLKEIKADESLRSIPVVILTTSEQELDVARAYEHHVNSYLVKPFDFDMFGRMIHDLGFYWLAWNHQS